MLEKNSKYKEVDYDTKYLIVKKLVMELKNVNPSGCNVIINNLHPMNFFFKNIEN